MKTLVSLVFVAFCLSACDGEPLAPESPAVPGATPAGAPPAAPADDPCAIPTGDTLLLKQCDPVSTRTVCIAQDYPYSVVPAGVTIHQKNLAGCPIADRPAVICVPSCQADGGIATTPVVPPSPDAGTPPDPPEVFTCDVPDGWHTYVLSCPGQCKVCIAQDQPYSSIPLDVVTHKINLAGCTLPGSPSIVCVADCSSPCPI